MKKNTAPRLNASGALSSLMASLSPAPPATLVPATLVTKATLAPATPAPAALKLLRIPCRIATMHISGPMKAPSTGR